MTPPKLSPDDEQWLQTYLASLPPSAFFNFETSTRNLIADQGIEWVRENEEWLRSEAEYVANL
jgi:hypothetical protein